MRRQIIVLRAALARNEVEQDMREQPDRDSVFFEIQAEIRASIDLQGFAIRHVLPSKDEPGFISTVGLYRQGLNRPELFISGLRPDIGVAWLLDLGFRIQGPPPLNTRKQMARVQGVAVHSLVFPPGGQTFLPGRRYRDLADSGLPTCFGEVEEHYYADHFAPAMAFHHGQPFPVLQMVWADTRGVFPWEDGFERRFLGKQRLLFDPQLSLPLIEAKP